MDEYRNVQNLSKLALAAAKMLKDRFNVSLTDDKLELLINNISQDVNNEYSDAGLKLNELNNITLTKIKQLVQRHQKTEQKTAAPPVQQPQQKEEEQPDSSEDTILAKVREFEALRRTQSQTFKVAPASEGIQTAIQPVAQQLPQQLAQPANQIINHYHHQESNDNVYKTFIINSVNRDWIKCPQRNNLKFQIPVSPHYNYNFYPDSILFPSYVKNMTPYVLANFTDGVIKYIYTFVLSNHQASAWDTWKTLENCEKIAFNNKQWTVKFYDFLNNELDLGSDDINIVEATELDSDHYIIKYDKQMPGLTANSYTMMMQNTGKVHSRLIVDHSADDKLITIHKNELTLADFINSKLMHTAQQYSIVIRYHYVMSTK